MARIGFIGLGHMGQPMALNLIKAGHQLQVFDLSEMAVDQVVAQGATAVADATQAADSADVIITMLQTGEQVKATCEGASGLFAAMDKKALYIDCSSIDVETSRELHKKAASLGLAMCDAPVSGGVKGAEAAALTIMVGAEKINYEKAKPYLELLGKKVIYAGAAGNGQVAKICNNMILGVSMIAVSEAFVLGEKLGLDAKTFFEISSNASGQCWAMTSYCPVPDIMENVPANNNYQPGFAAAMMLKDLNLSQQAADYAKVKTTLGKAATNVYQEFVNANQQDIDFSGVIGFIKKP